MADIDFTFVDMIEREIHDHEVVFSFQGDEGAEMFHEWWCVEGYNAFVAHNKRLEEENL